MKRIFPLFFSLILILAACAPQAPAAEAGTGAPPAGPTQVTLEEATETATETTPTESAEATITPANTTTSSPVAVGQDQQGSYPLGTRTDIPELDAILTAVASGDTDELRPLIEFSSLECTRQDGLGGPPKCKEGEPAGTPVEALPFLGSEGSFLRRDEFESWLGIDPSGLYAIYQNSPNVYEDEFYPAGEQTMLLAGGRAEEAVALRIRGGRIVRIDSLFSFGMESLDAILEREAAQMILAPASR